MGADQSHADLPKLFTVIEPRSRPISSAEHALFQHAMATAHAPPREPTTGLVASAPTTSLKKAAP